MNKANSNPPSHPSRNNKQVSCFWTQPNLLMLLEEGFGLLGYQGYLFGNYSVQYVLWSWAGIGNWIWTQSSGSAVTSPVPGSSLYMWNGMILNDVVQICIASFSIAGSRDAGNSCWPRFFMWFCTASQKWIVCHVNMTVEALLSNSFNEYWRWICVN